MCSRAYEATAVRSGPYVSVRTAHRPCASPPPRMTLYICSRHAPMSTLAFLSCIALAEHTVAAGRGTPAGLWGEGVRERGGAVSTNASSFAGEAADQRTAQQAQRGQVGAAEPRARRQPAGRRPSAIALKYGISIATGSRSCGNASRDPNTKSDDRGRHHQTDVTRTRHTPVRSPVLPSAGTPRHTPPSGCRAKGCEGDLGLVRNALLPAS